MADPPPRVTRPGIRESTSIKRLNNIPTVAAEYRRGTISPAVSFLEPNYVLNQQVSLITYDITKLQVDAIVNAATPRLRGSGGGVEGAVHQAAGRDLFRACVLLNGCETGSAKITDGFDLPCKRIIHTVGPIYDTQDGGAESERLLRSCYRMSLELAVQNGCRTIAFSCISTSVDGYPSKEASRVALSEVRMFLEGCYGDYFDRVIFCCLEQTDADVYDKNLGVFFPPSAREVSGGRMPAEPSQGSPSGASARGQTPPRHSPSGGSRSRDTSRTPSRQATPGSASGRAPSSRSTPPRTMSPSTSGRRRDEASEPTVNSSTNILDKPMTKKQKVESHGANVSRDPNQYTQKEKGANQQDLPSKVSDSIFSEE